MHAMQSVGLKKHDVLVDCAQPARRWRVVDHWRDVFVLERMDGLGKRRFAYAEELEDMSKFKAIARSAVALRARRV